ncbi:divisome-associated lipoprotein YraP [Salinimonas sp. HHU 13199]|uniref:Divisome-associated lipoprotein YraP n=1 Tax=Salinimonas profundi TaxID=2729140 RepID=A0ABR8LLH8_9ALTE|nr:division/outer membrane stress-associated lipid-binding lipoprotein [Salinimonas profundi]MBD3586168.1 divisome-associated lipoprotein YraP [Salinimonas profundi]
MTNRAFSAGVLALIIATIQLQGCVVAAVGAGAAAAAKVANDRRTVGTQLDDQNAEGKVSFRWAKYDRLKDEANLRVDVYNGVALMTGQAPDRQLIEQAVSEVQQVAYIRKIHNQVRVGTPQGASSQAYDLWLANKIRAKLLANDNVPSMQIKVVVENSEVFLMGRVTNQEATYAVDIARNVDGVQRVVRAFEIT